MSHEDSTWLQGLKSLAQRQGFLTYADVNVRMPITIVDPEEISRIVDLLEAAGISVVPDSPKV
jgi:Sigma-70 factor, region 1.1